MDRWWRRTVFYEIYMTAFCDRDAEGSSGIRGIISKLPYLKELGVGGIWLTPFYPSPKVDNGYDVSDYYGVDPDYGTMKDLEKMIEQAHGHGIRVIVDMVVNHTSTLHPWFLESASSRNSLKRDWYIWKDSVEGEPPNNWESFFGGSAWEFDQASKQYYYHSFAKEQADLNWQNPQVEEAVFRVLDFWLLKGVDGFRFDVINNLSVSGGLEDNPVSADGEQLHENDVNQPGIHEAIGRICKWVRARNADAFLVGEISSDELERIHSYTGVDGLDATFNFNLGSRESFCADEVMEELRKMKELYGPDGNPTLFFGSHDMRRFPDRFGFTEEKVKCLLTLLMVCKGIPFLYFGDEVGMRSRVLGAVEEARDVQGILAYEKALEEGKDKEEAVRILNEMSRDASRNPMDWEEAKRQRRNPESIWNHVKGLAMLRCEDDVLINGSMELEMPKEGVMEVIRSLDGRRIRTILNFSDGEASVPLESGSRVLFVRKDQRQGRDKVHMTIPEGGYVILEEREVWCDDQTETGKRLDR